MDDSAEARVSLIVAGSDAAEFFEALEEVLDRVPPFVHLMVVEDRRLSICLGGDDGDGAPVAQDGPQGVAVEGLVGDKGLEIDARDQRLDADAVVPLAGEQDKACQIA